MRMREGMKMYITDYLERFKDKKIRLFVDMDGVVADFDVGKPYDYDKKRPLLTNIEVLREIAKRDNIEMYILTITSLTVGREEKNRWLDQYMEFIKKEKRFIISREENNKISSRVLKNRFLKKVKRDDSVIIMIDDDPSILGKIRQSNPDIYLLKDTALVK